MSAADTRIITFGAATQDVFLTGKALTGKRDVRSHDWVEQFPLGAKVELEGAQFDVGGGATNAAVTFARQGFSTGFVGKVGRDLAGDAVLRVLEEEKVGTERVARDQKHATGYAVLLLAPSGERTVLVYRGASHDLRSADVAIRTLEADWFYISSLAGNFDLLTRLLKHANAHGINVALDPGAGELADLRKLRALLPLVTVLKANAEELGTIFGGHTLETTVSAAAGTCEYVVGTDGPGGSYAAYNGKLYRAGTYKRVKVVDRTGAGDAFGSGFVAALAHGRSIEEALSLGSANATSVVTVLGAKAGILKAGRVKKMKVEIIEL